MALGDQVSPFKAFVNDDVFENGFYHGTIFRFPLRNRKSKLSGNIYNKSKVEGLFQSFKVEAEDTLIFVNHVTKISLKMRERPGWTKSVLQVESEVVLGQDRKSDFVEALKSHSKIVEDESNGGAKTLELSDDSEEATWSLKIKRFERNDLQGIHFKSFQHLF